MNGRSRYPFTAAQWQELEHQALVFKYMTSGIPVPPDLLLSVKRSSFDSAFTSKLFVNQPHHAVGWNYLQMGLERKIDPEPGRCRRTDGKKWRCSKEAYPDSKYCERHMHRGKNRSRKPVEELKKTESDTPTPAISSIAKNLSPPLPSLFSLSSSDTQDQLHHFSHLQHPFLYQHSSSSPRLPGISPLALDTATYFPTAKGYSDRCLYGLKEEVDEHAFFSEEPSGTMSDPWQPTPLTMSCSSSISKERNGPGWQSDRSCLQLPSLTDTPKQLDRGDQYFASGNNAMAMKMKEEGPHKTVHRFFDVWPPKDRESLLGLDDKTSNTCSVSGTQLSISTPTSAHDFPIFKSRTHDGS